MTGAASAKTLLKEYNQEQYRAFTLNKEPTLVLPGVSSVPWVGGSQRRDRYQKKISHIKDDHHVKFITKNDEPYAFIWQTQETHLKQALRWGIVKTQSITGKVIASLGQYRVVAHERVVKGMISNSHAIKMKLLDLFQDRFEALQAIESLVNKNNTKKEYQDALLHYIQTLEKININLNTYFDDVDLSGVNEKYKHQIKDKIKADIKRTYDYLRSLNGKANFRQHASVRGGDSAMVFVKQQMIHGLYEFQGVNQDLTYSSQRYFALTRGKLNDFIEDARKEIDDHQPDLRNAVTAKHHGLYAEGKDKLVSYDFSDDKLTPAREREILSAISFIEGWDVLQCGKNTSPTVSNKSGKEQLQTIAATEWKTHKNFLAGIKSIGLYILKILQGIFVATHPIEEKPWKNHRFKLIGEKLHKYTKPNEPLWKKPLRFFKKIAHAVIDILKGVYDFGTNIIIKMPTSIINDWESSQRLPPLENTLTHATKTIRSITLMEKIRLKKILKRCQYSSTHTATPNTSTLAEVDYDLTAGDQNDILTAIAHGLNGFSSIFTHHIYAKDPIAGIIFTGAYAVGAGAIYLPSATASIFGTGYVQWFTDFAHTMGASKLTATIAGSSTQAQLFVTGWDSVMRGPNGSAIKALYQYGEDPLTISAYFLSAYCLGYYLANGINDCKIPWLSKHLSADLGTVPQASYPFIGAKIALVSHEILLTEHQHETSSPEELVNHIGGDALSELGKKKNKRIIERFHFVHWLFTNAKVLPKLDTSLRFEVVRQIEGLFHKEDSDSLKKLLYPEDPTSIAFQMVYIPLYYIPCLLRFITSIFLSIAALICGKPSPLEPVKRAANHLIERVKKDLSRLIVFATTIIYLPYTLISSLLKVSTYFLIMCIGRVASLFNSKPALFMHGLLASVHNFFRKMGESLYPAQLLKNVTIAHPTHTIKKIATSYIKLIELIGIPAKQSAINGSSDHPYVPSFFKLKKRDNTSPIAASTADHCLINPIF